jgi:hypothetical protein
MTYQLELLVEQRLADLRRTGEASQRWTRRPATSRRPVKMRLGQILVRVGDRLAQPAGAAALR